MPTSPRINRFLRKHHAAQLKMVLPFDKLESLPIKVQEQIAHLRKGIPTVAVLYYGGTIGMTLDKEGRLIPASNEGTILKPLLIKGLKEIFQVVWFQVYPIAIDSTNGRWLHWTTIGNAIKTLYDLVDGFVIMGGTDTMSHLCAAINFMFPNSGKPMICTGSQQPSFRMGDDATVNSFFSIVVAATGDISGSHLAFNNSLRHGLHIFKIKDKEYNAFDSPQQHLLGHFDGEAHIYPIAPRRSPLVTGERLEYIPYFYEGVKIVKLSPATPSESLLHDAKDPTCCSILVITYGAGNVRDEPSYEGEMTHLDVIKHLREMEYPVVLGSPMMDGVVNSPYISGAMAISPEIGGISAGDTCGSTLEVKMMRCLYLAWDSKTNKLNYRRFHDEMFRNHVGELTPHKKDKG